MENKSITWRDRLRTLSGRLNPFVSGAFGALLVFFIFYLFNSSTQITERELKNVVAQAMASATPRTPDAVIVYQTILPSIVVVEAEYEDAEDSSGSSLGTGVIIDDSANILTSLHVVQGSNHIQISFSDGSISQAFILNELPEQDLAILRAFNTPNVIVPATLGNPGAMRVGDPVYVVGHPLGYYASMSAGVLSGFNREFHPEDGPPLTGLIQFDAAANPGNSGGPLLNSSGHVIGIVTGIVGSNQGSFFTGIGFAVPITTAASGPGGGPPY